MNVVDSSAWLEYLADGPNAGFFASKTLGFVVAFELSKDRDELRIPSGQQIQTDAPPQ